MGLSKDLERNVSEVRKKFRSAAEEQVRVLGTNLLQYIQRYHPGYRVTGVERRNYNSFHYKIRTRYAGGLSFLFPKTLVDISLSNSIQNDPIISVKDKDFFVKDERLGELAKKFKVKLKTDEVSV